MSGLLLTPTEARVLAALVEKSIATPQYYPMSANALMLASNQKTARHPLMNLTEGDVGAALNRLEQDKLTVRDDVSSRVPKWRHYMHNQLLLQPPALAVLVTLILRGAQTLAELRASAAVLGGPADNDGVAQVLHDLTDRAQPLVVLLPRAAGQKEARYAHLLSGTPPAPTETPTAEPATARDGGSPARGRMPEPATARDGGSPARGRMPEPARAEAAGIEERLRALEARIAALEQRLPPPA